MIGAGFLKRFKLPLTSRSRFLTDDSNGLSVTGVLSDYLSLIFLMNNVWLRDLKGIAQMKYGFI